MTHDVQPRAIIELLGNFAPHYEEILAPHALSFVARLARRFEPRRRELMAKRAQRQAAFDAGVLPDFLPETRAIRDGDWRIGEVPHDLQDRRVEITGPTDRKMVINALNSGANVFMADFEDSTSPTWRNLLAGQQSLAAAVRGDLEYTAPNGKHYRLRPYDEQAVLIVRPRGWHLDEKHVAIDGQPLAGGLFDAAVFAFHNARTLQGKDRGPYFYLPKLQSMEEAALWETALSHIEGMLGLPHGQIKVTVLIETLPAVFEMDEILHALRDRIVGLNCGRWDYIFSFIKRLGRSDAFLTPNRAAMVMGKAFLGAYSLKLIQTCHRRGAFAMGGMAAQIPIKGDPEANAAAFAKVKADKEREAGDGHDGTWVAHPDLVPVAMEVFDRLMPTPNQLHRLREDVDVGQADMLRLHDGARSEQGVRENIRVGIRYTQAWMEGRGAVPLYNLMEDAATAEISRTQLWQWVKLKASLDDGRRLDEALFVSLLDQEMAGLRAEFASPKLEAAAGLFRRMVLDRALVEFLTLPAYEALA
jgi:malate synthase